MPAVDDQSFAALATAQQREAAAKATPAGGGNGSNAQHMEANVVETKNIKECFLYSCTCSYAC